MLLSLQGRYEEAIAQIRRAREVDPFSMIIHHEVGQESLQNARQHFEALDYASLGDADKDCHAASMRSEDVDRIELQSRRPRLGLTERIDSQRPPDERGKTELHALLEHVEHVEAMLGDIGSLTQCRCNRSC